MHAVGQVISGKYKLLRLLGDGGMGTVYEAEHLGLGTRVAIKMLHPDLVRRTSLAERFLQEARVSAQIRSPHVVQVTDVDRTPEGVAYLVMELLRGEPLSSVVRREGTMSVGTALEYTTQILVALEAAHALGVIHRDLKPDNVFVTFDGGKPVLKLIDFGIAKLRTSDAAATKNLTVAGMLMGTPEYMAPEQLYSADKVDVRADLFSVGCMLYEMLSGRTPTSGEDPRVVVLKAERGEVTPLVHAAPGVPPEIAGLVHRAMAPRPELRFANATEMRLALEAVASGKREGAGAFEPSRDGKTGTMMGAPAQAAVLPSSAPGPYGSTVRAAPVGGQTQMGHLGQAGPAGPLVPHLPSASEPDARSAVPRRQGKGLVVGLAMVALLLGAGAVVAYVLGTQEDAPIATPAVGVEPTGTTGATSPPTTGTASAPPLTAPTSAPPLAPGPVTAAPPAARPSPTPSGSTPPPAASGTAAPSVPVPAIPSGIPPFVLPTALPSGLPTALPSGLPFPPGFQLPSAFPTAWPPPAPVQGE